MSSGDTVSTQSAYGDNGLGRVLSVAQSPPTPPVFWPAPLDHSEGPGRNEKEGANGLPGLCGNTESRCKAFCAMRVTCPPILDLVPMWLLTPASQDRAPTKVPGGRALPALRRPPPPPVQPQLPSFREPETSRFPCISPALALSPSRTSETSDLCLKEGHLFPR